MSDLSPNKLCPFCSALCPPISANDGGSNVCSKCGLWHMCIDGPVHGSPGPALCPKCKHTIVWSPTVAAPPVSPTPFTPIHRIGRSAWCDGCDATLSSATPGLRFKCEDCPNFDFCASCVTSKQHNNLHTFIDMHGRETIPTPVNPPPNMMYTPR